MNQKTDPFERWAQAHADLLETLVEYWEVEPDSDFLRQSDENAQGFIDDLHDAGIL